jgi:hypothetical protein
MSVRSGVLAGEIADMHGQRPCKAATSTFTRPAEFPATRRADIPRYPGKRKSLDVLLATSFGPVPHPVKHHDFSQFLARARALVHQLPSARWSRRRGTAQSSRPPPAYFGDPARQQSMIIV